MRNFVPNLQTLGDKIKHFMKLIYYKKNSRHFIVLIFNGSRFSYLEAKMLSYITRKNVKHFKHPKETQFFLILPSY